MAEDVATDARVDADALYRDALRIVVADQRASTSYLQRRLAVGFNTAAGLIDRLQDAGVVSAPNHAGKRTVLASMDKASAVEGASTVTISGPGMEPVTMTDAQLKQVADKLAETSKFKIDETTREKLRQTVAKIERLEEEKKEVAAQIKDVYGEAKAIGFDTRALRQVIRDRKVEKSEREERQMMLDLYMEVVGG